MTDCDHTAGEKKSTAADFNMVSVGGYWIFRVICGVITYGDVINYIKRCDEVMAHAK